MRRKETIGFTPQPVPLSRDGRDSAPRRKSECKGASAVKPRGFTLAELLIVSVLLVLISGAIFSTFRAGLSVWKFVQGGDSSYYARAIQREKMNRDLRQTFFYKDIAFSGNNTTISFPAIIRSEINEVSYRFDEKDSALIRVRCPLQDILAAREAMSDPKGTADVLLEGVKSLVFSYFYNKAPGGYQWNETWNVTIGMPTAVRYNITFNDNTTGSETIFLPCYQ